MGVKQIMTTLIMAITFSAPGSMVLAADMPDQVALDSIAKLFEGIEFDHAMHTDLGEDCSVCHHHTTGTGTTNERCISCHASSGEGASVSCRDCHVADPFSAEHISREASNRYQFHIDMPGLKAAYHWNCIGCHEEMGGPTDCLDCHARTPEGDDFYKKNASRSKASDKGGD